MRDLESLKYAELRQLAKSVGIKANLKQEKLIAELNKYYSENENTNDEQEQKKKTPVVNSQPKVQKATPSTTPVIVNETNTYPPKSKETNASKLSAKTLIQVSKSQTPKSKPTTPLQKPIPAQPSAPQTDLTVTQPESISLMTAPPSSPEMTTEQSSAPVSTAAESTTPLAQPHSGSRWEKKVYTPTQVTSSSATAQAGKRKHPETPSDEQSAKKNRRSTFEKDPTPGIKTPEVVSSAPEAVSSASEPACEVSPGVDDMLRAMRSDMSSQEMKEALMTAIDTKVHNKMKNAPASTATSTNIPRFAAFALKIKEEKKPITPGNKDWKRIHEKQFEKFDSIDVYLDKKRKRAEELTTSVKKARTILDEVHSVATRLKAHKTPVLDENKPEKQRRSNPNKTTPFKPTVINTSQMNLNFGAIKSPKAFTGKSPKSVVSSKVKSCTSGRSARKSAGCVEQKSMTTPFKFTATAGNTTTLNSTASTKKAFDLKASLAKPLTWKPHKGKLRPVDGGSTKSPVYVKTAIKDLKTAAKVQTERVNARSTVNERRVNKKEQAQMARRGIKM